MDNPITKAMVAEGIKRGYIKTELDDGAMFATIGNVEFLCQNTRDFTEDIQENGFSTDQLPFIDVFDTVYDSFNVFADYGSVVNKAILDGCLESLNSSLGSDWCGASAHVFSASDKTVEGILFIGNEEKPFNCEKSEARELLQSHGLTLEANDESLDEMLEQKVEVAVDSVISADVLLQAAGLMNESLREKVHAELAPCTNDQFVQRYCQLDPSFADTMHKEFNIDVSDIHQEKNIDAVLYPAECAKNELREALMGDQKSFVSLLKEYGNDRAEDYFNLYDSIEQVAVEEDWSYERQQIQTQDLDRNAELYRFDPLGFLEATSAREVISEVLEEFDDFCDWVSDVDLEYIGAYRAVDDDIKHAMAQYQDAVGKSGDKHQVSDEESLDEMMEQKVEVAGDSEIGDEMSVSNGER